MNKAIYLLALLAVALSACKKTPIAKPPDVDYYTCTMHPSVHSEIPGKCPVCSMELVPVMKNNSGSETDSAIPAHPSDAKQSDFVVPVERQQQIGVTYATVERKPLYHTIRALGVVEADIQRQWSFVARVDGYVQKLFVASPGEVVTKNVPMVSIYSPDVLTTEREFAMLLKMRDEAKTAESREGPERLISSARLRLQQWNLTPDQIADLESSRRPSDILTLQSPFDGVVEEVSVRQGTSVKAGDKLVEVADLSVVWVWADFYESELSMLEKGQKVTVTTKSYPDERFNGEVAVINPFVEEVKRTCKVRIDIANSKLKLRPGMYATAELGMDMGNGLVIPTSAVMPTGARNVVFVDKGGGKLEPRAIQLGYQYADYYEIAQGLSEGERVVASANFLIDAESKVQGALKDFGEVQTSSHSEISHDRAHH